MSRARNESPRSIERQDPRMVGEKKTPYISPMASNVLRRVGRMIPPMSGSFHKGQLGRVGVIGGSEDYTGAPYFSAMASAKLGCDMSHVICTPGAGAVIKTYSPNLMVHPLMRQSHDRGGLLGDDLADAERVSRRIISEMLPRLHVLVIGPGLGRDPLMQETVARVMSAAREKKMPLVLDADALQVVQRRPELVRGYANAVLTPNVVEFKRLCDAFGVKDDDDHGEHVEQKDHKDHEGGARRVELLAKTLGGVTIIQKGRRDFISNGKVTLINDLEGGRKRSGGQGDTLTGAVATFLAWRKAYLDRLWEEYDYEEEEDHDTKREPRLEEDELMGLAAFGGSAITRECSRLAFAAKGRSMQASDLTEQVHDAFLGLFGER